MGANDFTDMENAAENILIPMTSLHNGNNEAVASDVYCYTTQIVNVCFAGDPDGWVLIDTGMPRSADRIIDRAAELFGKNAKPQAIILTHGHFDHVGGVVELVKHWKVKVYANELEIPYLTGKSNYPEPDWTVEGGIVAKLSRWFPNEAIDLGGHIGSLPSDGSVPGMPGWRWIHTPGHTPGHISLFREKDRGLISGDALLTVEQDALYDVLIQKKQVSGPPVYYTTDWPAAEQSAKKLESLNPAYVVPGHGSPMGGEPLTQGLSSLIANFGRNAVPEYGRYVHHE